MTVTKLLGLAALGGLIYAHKRHGGQFNVNSIKQSGRDLMDAAKTRSQDLRAKASTRVHEVADRMGEKRRGKEETIIEEVTSTGYGYSGGYPQQR